MPPNETQQLEIEGTEPDQVACDHCGDEVDPEDTIGIDGSTYCEDCVGTCETCNDRTLASNLLCGPGDDPICETCYDTYTSSCPECGTRFWNDDGYYSERAEDNFCSGGCAPPDSELGDIFRSPSIPHDIPATDPKQGRYIGAELEVDVNDPCSFADRWDNWHTFGAVEDGSISGDNAVELLTPPLPLERFCTTMQEFTDDVSEYLSVNRSMGYHLHIAASDLSWSEVDRLIVWAHRHQDWFFKLVSPSRRGDNSFCQRIPNAMGHYTSPSKQAFFERLYGNKLRSTLRKANLWMKKRKAHQFYATEPRKFVNPKQNKYADQRYSWLNLHSWAFRRTIEIRLHQGTVNAWKITNWARMWVLLIEAVCREGCDNLHPVDILQAKAPELLEYADTRMNVFNRERTQTAA
jgi:hypothetical protein